MNNNRAKRLTMTAMLCALAYIAAVVGRIPIVLFLRYDPKDVIIVIGGLIFGPLTSLIISVIVSVVQMVTVSGTGILGCLMNIISSCSFACTAAIIYGRGNCDRVISESLSSGDNLHKKNRTFRSATPGLVCGWGCQVVVMMLWNYLVAPIYMGYPREAIVELLLPAFLPFNLIKGGLNTAITMLLYKPVVVALHQLKLITSPTDE